MRKIVPIMLSMLFLTAVMLTGCTSDNEDKNVDNAAFAEDPAVSTNASAAKDFEGKVIFYPTLDEKYKTCNNEMFNFWFDIPVEWNAVDRTEDGSEYYILPGNYKIDMKIYGVIIDETQNDFYENLATKNGEISDFIFRDGWIGKKIKVSENEVYYVRIDGDSYIVFYVNTEEVPEWKTKNEEIINHIAESARTTRESIGRITDDNSTISPDDLKLGEISVGMTYERLLFVIGQEPVDLVEEEYEGMKTKMVYFADDTQVYVVNDIVYTVNVIDPGYLTPRGLKIGDDEERILELYGEPNKKEDGIWGYNINGYELFTVVVTDGLVSQIQIEQGVWSAEVF